MVLVYFEGTKLTRVNHGAQEVDLSELPVPMDAPRCEIWDLDLVWFEGRKFRYSGNELSGEVDFTETTFDVINMYSYGDYTYCIGETMIGIINSTYERHTLNEHPRHTSGDCIVIYAGISEFKHYEIGNEGCFDILTSEQVPVGMDLRKSCSYYLGHNSGDTKSSLFWGESGLGVFTGPAWKSKKISEIPIYYVDITKIVFYDMYWRQYIVKIDIRKIQSIEIGLNGCLIKTKDGLYAVNHESESPVRVEDDCTLVPARPTKSARN